MKFKQLLYAVKKGEYYPNEKFQQNRVRHFIDWDALLFRIDYNMLLEFSCDTDYTYRPNVLLTAWKITRSGVWQTYKPNLIVLQEEKIDMSACAVDIAEAALGGNTAAMNLRRYL